MLLKFKRSAFGYSPSDVDDYLDELAEKHDVELEHKDIEIRRLKVTVEQLQSQTQGIETAGIRLKELEAERDSLTLRLSETTAELARLRNLEKTIPEWEAEIRRLKGDIERFDTLLRQKDTRLEGYQTEVEQLKAELEQVKRAQEEAAAAQAESSRVEGMPMTAEPSAGAVSEVVALDAADASEAFGAALSYEWADDAAQAVATVEELSEYLSKVTMEVGQKALQRTAVEFRNFRHKVIALKHHLANLTAEVNTYRSQEKAIAQALIQAQLRAAQMEDETLTEVIKKKEQIDSELSNKMAELESVKKTMNTLRTGLSSLLDSYSDRKGSE